MNPEDSQRLFEVLDRLENGQARLTRGLYGDPENGVPGIVREVATLKEGAATVNRKIAWVSGMAAGVGAFVPLAIKKIFQD
jgi:hypothetical protein